MQIRLTIRSFKDEILLVLTEDYWQKALLEMEAVNTGASFCEQLQEIGAKPSRTQGHFKGLCMDGTHGTEALQTNLKGVCIILILLRIRKCAV